jgi:hypothetical protein
MLLKTPLRFEPTSVTAAMMTTEMSAAMRPYSIAVAPFSSRRRLAMIYMFVSPEAINSIPRATVFYHRLFSTCVGRRDRRSPQQKIR